MGESGKYRSRYADDRLQPTSCENAAADRAELPLDMPGVRAWLVTPAETDGGDRERAIAHAVNEQAFAHADKHSTVAHTDGEQPIVYAYTKGTANAEGERASRQAAGGGTGAFAARFVPGQAGPYLLVEAAEPLRTLNSAPWGGGFGLYRRLVNRQVDKSYDCDDPNAEMEAFLRGQRLDGEAAACLLTAARVADAGVARAAYGAARVTSLVTVGLGNKARAGLAQPAPQLFPGTINAIVLVDGAMTDAAMVNAALTATEAKAAALQALDERVAVQPSVAAAGADGGNAAVAPAYATGTTTDAVLVAATGRGPLHRYAGTATEVGYLIGRTVHDAVLEAGRRYQAYAREAAAAQRPDPL